MFITEGNYIINKDKEHASIRDKEDNILIECNDGLCNEVIYNETTPKYYLDEKTKTIISCPSGNKSCILEDPSINGYFINSGYENNDKKIIQCQCNVNNSESPCEKLANSVKTSCDTAGCINVDNADNPTTVTLCLKDSCTGDGDTIVITGNDKDVYKTITSTVFPGVVPGESTSVSIKVGKDESVILLEDTSLPPCTDDNVNSYTNACFTNAFDGQYCIYNKKIYKTEISEEGNASCSELTGSGKSVIYFDNAYGEVKNPATRNDIMAYICMYGESESVCELVKGYIIKDNQYIQCNGWKREGCIVEAMTSEENCINDSDEGKLKLLSNSKALCFGKEKNEMPNFETIDIDYIAFRTNDINTIYGINPEKIVFLSVTSDSIIVNEDPGKLLK